MFQLQTKYQLLTDILTKELCSALVEIDVESINGEKLVGAAGMKSVSLGSLLRDLLYYAGCHGRAHVSDGESSELLELRKHF